MRHRWRPKGPAKSSAKRTMTASIRPSVAQAILVSTQGRVSMGTRQSSMCAITTSSVCLGAVWVASVTTSLSATLNARRIRIALGRPFRGLVSIIRAMSSSAKYIRGVAARIYARRLSYARETSSSVTIVTIIQSAWASSVRTKHVSVKLKLRLRRRTREALPAYHRLLMYNQLIKII